VFVCEQCYNEEYLSSNRFRLAYKVHVGEELERDYLNISTSPGDHSICCRVMQLVLWWLLQMVVEMMKTHS